MADPATSLVERRGAERLPVSFSVPLDRPGADPLEARALNLSVSGLLIAAPADLPVWGRLTVRLPVIGRREVRVVRRDGDRYGCLFASALEGEDLDAVLASPEAEAGFARLQAEADAPPPLPKRSRLRLWGR